MEEAPIDTTLSKGSASKERQNPEEEEKDDGSKAFPVCILALYQFVTPTVSEQQVQQWRDEIDSFLRNAVHARGSVLLAVEGINGTICFARERADDVESFLRETFPKLKTRRSYSPATVYNRLKVRIKNEIVTMGPVVTDDPVAASDTHDEPPTALLRPVRTGEYVKPGPAWDALLRDPDCLVIDARNDYEIELGGFKGACNPYTSQFTEFPAWLERQVGRDSCSKFRPSKIAMYCTGGIRCEKATAYCMDLLAAQRIDDDNEDEIPVYHLEGGILAYLDAVPAEQSTFQGECFVFDKRAAVTHGLQPSDTYTLCHACRHPVHKDADTFHEGVYCPHCYHDENRRRQRYEERQKQIELWAEQGISHLHDPKEVKQHA